MRYTVQAAPLSEYDIIYLRRAVHYAACDEVFQQGVGVCTEHKHAIVHC